MLRLRSIFGIVLAGLLVAGISYAQAHAGVMQPVPGDPVRIDSGLVSGTMVGNGVRAYLGVPFAAPPVRENRWRAPQPVTPWKGIYTADAQPPECMQSLRSSDINHYFGEPSISEDCLHLDLWAPTSAKPGSKLPVVVWIYGGGFGIGSNSMAVYGGAPLAAKGVIYVEPNYRLGVLGFLALPPSLTGHAAGHPSGNWGLLDQIASLRWVRRNIAAFGGDPGNVTLVGQSAGSMSINDLQASPLAHGLFQRALGMSGATVGNDAFARMPTLSQAEAQGLKLQQAMKASSLAQMRAVASDRLLALARQAGVRAGPDIDGDVLPASPTSIFEQGRQSDIPVLTGSTGSDIGTVIPLRHAATVDQYRTLAAQMWGANAHPFLQAWPATNDADAHRQAEEVAHDSGMGLAALNWVSLQAKTGKAPAYLYLFTHVQPFAPGVTFSDFNPATAGAYHMSDVPYWLGTYDAFNLFRVTRDWQPLDRTLSAHMQAVILAYARTGNPNTPKIKFERFEPNRPVRTVIGNTIHIEPLNRTGIQFLMTHQPVPALRPGRGGPRPSY